jgi:sec-independent protein translocase protein TatA
MDFFGIGPWEVVLILIVALLVIGPGKIPGIARTLGRTVRAIRQTGSELTTAVTRELEAAEKAEKESATDRTADNGPSAGERRPRPTAAPEKHTPESNATGPEGAPTTK